MGKFLKSKGIKKTNGHIECLNFGCPLMFCIFNFAKQKLSIQYRYYEKAFYPFVLSGSIYVNRICSDTQCGF